MFKVTVTDHAHIEQMLEEMKRKSTAFRKLMGKIMKAELERTTSKFSKSGKLARSWKINEKRNGAIVYTEVPYAGKQDIGGSISPTRAQKLIIPKSSIARNIIHARSGRLFFSNNAVFKKHKFASEFLAARRDHVVLPAKHYIQPAVERAQKAIVQGILRNIDEAAK